MSTAALCPTIDGQLLASSAAAGGPSAGPVRRHRVALARLRGQHEVQLRVKHPRSLARILSRCPVAANISTGRVARAVRTQGCRARTEQRRHRTDERRLAKPLGQAAGLDHAGCLVHVGQRMARGTDEEPYRPLTAGGEPTPRGAVIRCRAWLAHGTAASPGAHGVRSCSTAESWFRANRAAAPHE